ncbi:MAG: dienelactone hydrolase family protein [Pseudomonadota bacterium]
MSDLRRELEILLGYENQPLQFSSVERIGEREGDSWEARDLRFSTFDGEIAPAWFVLPQDCREPLPALLYLHAHGNRYDIGRDELFDGRPALEKPYIDDLLARGFAVLCIEMPCFGARQEPNESSRSKAHLWHGTTLFGRMLHELRCGLTFLADQPEVDAKRLGCLGISMGGTHAYWLAALDERVQAAVSLCAFADLACLVEHGGHVNHGHYMTVPGLLRKTTTGQIAGLSAPRSLFVGVGLQDWSSPVNCFNIAQAQVEATYAYLDARDRLQFHIEEKTGHHETASMRAAVLEFLVHAL